MLLRLYLVGFLCFLVGSCFEDLKNARIFLQKRTVIRPLLQKLPNKSDLTEYTEALDRIADFCKGHKNDIDINFYFGLFLADVNLKRVYGEKYQVIPGKIRVDLLKIIEKLDALLKFVCDMVRQERDTGNHIYKAIFTLFSNTSIWMNGLPKFHDDFSYPDEIKMDSRLLLQIMNTNDFNNVNAWVPNPQQSNQCLASLASANDNQIGTSRTCEIFSLCYEILLNGTDFGYALAHRLLLLQLARYGRDCSIFSVREDKRLARRFCSIAYQEAQHIAHTDYKLVDILLEHVSLCTLDGHVQFLKRSWLAKSLRFQTVHGCFSQDLLNALESADMQVYEFSHEWKIASTVNNNMIGGLCNGHTTGLAASAFAMAIRFIIEQY